MKWCLRVAGDYHAYMERRLVVYTYSTLQYIYVSSSYSSQRRWELISYFRGVIFKIGFLNVAFISIFHKFHTLHAPSDCMHFTSTFIVAQHLTMPMNFVLHANILYMRHTALGVYTFLIKVTGRRQSWTKLH